jgi:hypothetical protein
MSAQHVVTIKNVESKLVTHEGVEFSGKLIKKNKDLHMFDTWRNSGVIYIDGNMYRISNINFNVSTNQIDSQMKDGKYFIYKTSSIDSISINKRNFKRLGRTFYEVLLDKKDKMLLKKFDALQQQNSSNRMGGTIVRSRKLLKFKYLVKLEEGYKDIELNKKSVIDFFEGNEDKLFKFVKEEKLSYKKEKDLVKILNFMLDETS